MKISLNRLRSYVDINVPVETLCDKMVMAGFEVESVEDLSTSMNRVVAGKILSTRPHGNSDHLTICEVDAGGEKPLQIVTGAGNIFPGAYVPVALHGSRLPDGTVIKRGKLRGEESEGMLCSGGELALSEHDYKGAGVNGILILEGSPAPGTDMRDILGLRDTVIDFKITANRPDCNSLLGVAREAAVVLGTVFRAPEPVFTPAGGDVRDMISVTVEDYDLCPRYCGAVVTDVVIKDSPDWMRAAIRAAGMRPINNIVDITNFVMLETGQPMHAFDYDDIAGRRVIVRRAADGERMTTLDGREHTLSRDMLIIADEKAPSCLAGIMGGLNSEIKDTTSTIFFETAKFRRDNVRRTSRKLGLRTESSSRFERGVDIINTEYAMRRALQLMEETGSGRIVSGLIDENAGLPGEREITVGVDAVNGLLGLGIPGETMREILNSLSIRTELVGGELHCRVPSFRDDIEGTADIAEEVMRIYGYEHITGTPLRGEISRGSKPSSRLDSDRVKAALTSCGLYEIYTYSFISEKVPDQLRLPADDPRRKVIRLLNPLGDEYAVMRTQLAGSMLSVLSVNINRKNPSARLFELSKVFLPGAVPPVEQPEERPALCVGAYGEDEDFFTVKGYVESVLDLFGVSSKCERGREPYYHPGRCGTFSLEGKPVAVFGEVHPEVAAAFGIDGRVYLAEVDLKPLYAMARRKPVYTPLPRFPAVERDFALLCDKDLPVGDMEAAIEAGAGKLLESMKLFDVYTGAQIPEGKKSVAFNVVLRSSEGTLSQEEIDRATGGIVERLRPLGATLREYPRRVSG